MKADVLADGVHAVVPALEGTVGILNATNHLVSVIELGQLLQPEGHAPHPHDAMLLPSGDLVVATWAWPLPNRTGSIVAPRKEKTTSPRGAKRSLDDGKRGRRGPWFEAREAP